jgi:hypothetical protein
MRHRRHVFNGKHIETSARESANSRFTPGTYSFDDYFDVRESGSSYFFDRRLGNKRRGVRGGFFCTFKSNIAG